MSTASDPPDLAEVIAGEHRVVAELLDQLATARHDRFALAHRLIDELATHTAVEHQLLYPALRDIVPGGNELADAGQGAHRALRPALEALEASHPAEEPFEEALTTLRQELATHVPAEEEVMLPALRAVIGPDAMAQLGAVHLTLRDGIPPGLAGLPADLPEPRFRLW